MKVDGGCHCGHIRYEAEVDPDKVVICHCTDCQTLSGSAFRTVVPTNEGTFKLLSGEPKVYVKTGESGNKRVQTFCPGLRLADLLGPRGGCRQGGRSARRHHPPARPARPQGPVLVPLFASLARQPAGDGQAG